MELAQVYLAGNELVELAFETEQDLELDLFLTSMLRKRDVSQVIFDFFLFLIPLQLFSQQMILI